MTNPPARTGRQRRRQRSDGERTHAAILDAGARLASIEGIHGLTIGRLAENLGMSKSGLYAHFGSKEQLQLETIEAAQAVFYREVIGPAYAETTPMRRLEALVEAYFSYLERWVFPGGCFFASLLADADAREGLVRDAAAALERESVGALRELFDAARQGGEIDAGSDAEQLAFELYASFELSNYHFVLFRDMAVLERGRRAASGLFSRARAGTQ